MLKVPGAGFELAPPPSLRPAFRVELRPVGVRDAPEIERAVHDLRARAEWRPGRDGENVIGGKNTEGTKFSAVEMPASAKSAPSLERYSRISPPSRVTKSLMFSAPLKVGRLRASCRCGAIIIKQAAIKSPQQ